MLFRGEMEGFKKFSKGNLYAERKLSVEPLVKIGPSFFKLVISMSLLDAIVNMLQMEKMLKLHSPGNELRIVIPTTHALTCDI